MPGFTETEMRAQQWVQFMGKLERAHFRFCSLCGLPVSYVRHRNTNAHRASLGALLSRCLYLRLDVKHEPVIPQPTEVK